MKIGQNYYLIEEGTEIKTMWTVSGYGQGFDGEQKVTLVRDKILIGEEQKTTREIESELMKDKGYREHMKRILCKEDWERWKKEYESKNNGIVQAINKHLEKYKEKDVRAIRHIEELKDITKDAINFEESMDKIKFMVDGKELGTQINKGFKHNLNADHIKVGLIKPDYYHKNGLDPFEYIRKNKLDMFEGNVIKYVTRHKEKNRIEDLRKAITYIEYMIENYKEMYEGEE